ncbi:MAG: GxxExxY protein [Geothermobacteraceae bacterium]
MIEMQPRSHEGHEEKFEDLSRRVIGCALEVHKHLGPGLLESSYEQCLVYELNRAGIPVERQVELPILYKGVPIDGHYRIDLLIDNRLIVELKAVDKLLDVHAAQILTYMKLAKVRIRLLINFNQKYLRDGIRRFVL